MASDAVARAVSTAISLGSYINCIATNNSSRPVLINFIDYATNGAYGRGNMRVACTSNCVLAPGAFNQFSGPANDSGITEGSCAVNFTLL
jgi:hypothetical protein